MACLLTRDSSHDSNSSIHYSRDERYVIALGTYKPRMKCFDVRDLGMKFERCFDSEAVAFDFLSDDYSKLLGCYPVLS